MITPQKRANEENDQLLLQLLSILHSAHASFRYLILSIEHCSCASLYSLAKLLLSYPKRRFHCFHPVP